MGEFNIAPNTQIGKIVIEQKVYDDENAYHIDDEKYSRGGEFIENLVTDNHIEYCHRWFKLANVNEMLEDIDEYYSNAGFGKYSNLLAAFNSPIIPSSGRPQSPVIFNQPRVINPVIFYNNRNTEYSYYNLIEEAKKL